MADELAYLTATDVLARFADRSLSPVEFVEALIERAVRINPPINALTDCYFDEARALAGEAERRLRDPASRRPLEGVPVLVKDAQRVKDKRTTQGSLVFKDHVDDHSDPMIERLQAAGAIILARTAVPEFCLSGVCHSRLFGVTRNPWNLDYGPGGSSGGSGAALAAGLAPLATGTDIAGSIRIPASACGVVGYKPPHGRNPDGPPACFDRYNHCGPLARSVADAALMQNVTSGPHRRDHDSLREVVLIPAALPPVKGWRIAVSEDFGYATVSAEVRQALRVAVDVFRDLGAMVEDVDLGWTADVDRLSQHWYNAMHFGRVTVWEKARDAGLLTDYALKFAAAVERTTGVDDVRKAFETAHRMYATLGPVLERCKVLLCPTLAVAAVPAEHDPWDLTFKIEGVTVDPEYGWVLTHPFNMLSNCPVMSVPIGRGASGVPVGMQIVGRTFDDVGVFQAASAYERAVGGWFRTASSRPGL